MLFIVLTGCKKEEKYIEYQVGDIVTQKGIIYEYVDLMEGNETVYSFTENNEDVSYHDYYYYDMLNINQDIITPFSEKELSNNTFDEIIKASGQGYYLGAKYFKLTHVLLANYLHYGVVENFEYFRGFIIKGYNEKIPKNVYIPKTINKNFVLGIGYKGFENAPFETIEFMGDGTLVLPYGLNNLPNLKKIIFPFSTRILSKAISNCLALEEVYNVDGIMDASFYNLPNLKKLTYNGSHMNGSLRDIQDYIRVTIVTTLSIYRSPFYLCPNIEEITKGKHENYGELFEENNVIYQMVGESQYSIVYIKNNYKINLNKISNYNFAYNEEEEFIYFSQLNTGYPIQGKIDFEETDRLRKVDNEIYIKPMVMLDVGNILGFTNEFLYKTDYFN